MVLAISIIVSVVSVMSLVPAMQQYRLSNAYNTTLAAMRQARDNAVSQRTSYSVTFTTSVTPLDQHDHGCADAGRISGRSEYGDLYLADGCGISCANRASVNGSRRIRSGDNCD